MAEPGVGVGQHLGGLGVPRFYLPLDHLPAEQCVAVHHPAQGPEAARAPAHQDARHLAQEFSRGARRTKMLPNGPPVRIRCSSACGWRPAGGAAPMPMRSRPSCVPANTCAVSTTTGTSPSRPCAWRWTRQGLARWGEQPVHCAGVAHRVFRYNRGAVPRGRQTHRHRAAPAAGRWAQTPSRMLPTPTCPRPPGPSFPLTQIAKPVSPGSRACCGATVATTPSPCRATSSKACRRHGHHNCCPLRKMEALADQRVGPA